jgi:competence protein ComEA
MNALTRSYLSVAALAAVFLGLAVAADDEADRLPAGEGKQTLVKVCGECHGYESIRKLRLSKDDWDQKISDMVVNGARGTDEEMAAILDYLTKTFGPDSKIWVNTAPFSELKAILKLTNEETDALIAYRKQSGPFKQWQDMSKAPGVDAKKLEAAKDKMAF